MWCVHGNRKRKEGCFGMLLQEGVKVKSLDFGAHNNYYSGGSK